MHFSSRSLPRRLFYYLGVLSAATALHGCAVSAKANAPASSISPVTGSWSMYQDAPSHNAVLNTTHPQHWTVDAGGQVNGGLAVVGNNIFLDTLAGDVLAIDLRTGSELWSTHFDNEVMSTPIVTDGMVIVGTGRNPTARDKATAFAYDPNLPANEQGFWGRIGGDRIEALDASTGRVRWSYRTAGEDMPSPTILPGAIVFSNGDGHAYALDTASGAPRWRTSLSGIATMASATSADGRIFLSVCSDAMRSGATLALNASGKILWRSPYGNCDSSPTYANDRVFASGISNESASAGRTVIAALHATDGRPVWIYRTTATGTFTKVGSSERAIAGTYADGLYLQPIVTSDSVIAFDASTGRIRWQLHTAAPVKMSPVVYAGNVYFGDTRGIFYKVRERDGAVVKRRRFSKPFTTSPPVVVGGTLLCANGVELSAFAL